MRRHQRRPSLPETAVRKLESEAKALLAEERPEDHVIKLWKNARRCRWFDQIVDCLSGIAGEGDPCMYCDSSEASDVEHVKPKGVSAFTHLTFVWENMLWVCGKCNRLKGNQYPPETCEGAEILNPLEVDPWEYMYIDELTGLLSGLWREDEDEQDQRAESTIFVLKLNREQLQARRRHRVRQLKRLGERFLEDIESDPSAAANVRAEIEEESHSSFQPDVTDYFFAGPGRESEPFRTLFQKLDGN